MIDKKLGYAALILVMGACTNPQKEVVEELKEETIDLHDEVMPRMGEVVGWADVLKKERDSVMADSADTLGLVRKAYTQHIARLDSAHEAMMVWMADYDPDYEQAHGVDSAIIYYQGQREEIIKVKHAIERSIEDASALGEKAN